IALTLTESGTFTIGGIETTPPGAKDIDFVLLANTGMPVNGEAAQLVGVCSRGGSALAFTDGVTADIAGATCGGGGGGGDLQTLAGSTILGIYVLNTNTMDLGNTSGNEELGAVSPGTRPSSVSSSIYTKQ